MSDYTFSYFIKTKAPRLTRRSWWNVFGRDSIEMVDSWERKVFTGLTKAEADIIISASSGAFNSALSQLLLRLMGGKPIDIQLEQGASANEYIKTEGKAMKEQK